jgi:hypothetical protein
MGEQQARQPAVELAGLVLPAAQAAEAEPVALQLRVPMVVVLVQAARGDQTTTRPFSMLLTPSAAH